MKARAFALIFILLVACTSNSDDGADSQSTRDEGRPSASAQQNGTEESPTSEEPADNSSDESPEASSITVKEDPGDATSSGDVDAYPELSSAKIDGSDVGALFDLGFAKSVPEHTPKATQMTIALSIIDSEGGRYLLNAIGAETGWTATVVTSEGQANFGGKFKIEGKSVKLGIPWTDLGGPKPFNWIVSSSWTGDPDKGMAYAFDSIPNRGFEGFPATD